MHLTDLCGQIVTFEPSELKTKIRLVRFILEPNPFLDGCEIEPLPHPTVEYWQHFLTECEKLKPLASNI